jgi:hypothetical protein
MTAKFTVTSLFMLYFCCAVQGGVLDFEGLGILSGQSIPQTYGDAANVDVQYVSRTGTGNSSVGAGSLQFWSTGYLGATNVAYGNSVTGEVFFQPIGAFQVQLVNFVLAPLLRSRTTQWAVYDASFNLLASSGGTFGLSSATTFTPNQTSANGIRLQFGPDDFNVAIDNITFNLIPTGVPEPSTILVAPGLLLLFIGSKSLRRR